MLDSAQFSSGKAWKPLAVVQQYVGANLEREKAVASLVKAVSSMMKVMFIKQ